MAPVQDPTPDGKLKKFIEEVEKLQQVKNNNKKKIETSFIFFVFSSSMSLFCFSLLAPKKIF